MSSMAACDALIDKGAQVIGVMAIFSYGFEKASKLFDQKKIPLDTLTNYRSLLAEAMETNYISQSEKEMLEGWNKDPQAWSAQLTG